MKNFFNENDKNSLTYDPKDDIIETENKKNFFLRTIDKLVVLGKIISKVHHFLFFIPLTVEVFMFYLLILTVSYFAGYIVNR